MMKRIFALVWLSLIVNAQAQAAPLADEKLACLLLHEAAQKGELSDEDKIAFRKCIASDQLDLVLGPALENDVNGPGLAGGGRL